MNYYLFFRSNRLHHDVFDVNSGVFKYMYTLYMYIYVFMYVCASKLTDKLSLNSPKYVIFNTIARVCVDKQD